MPSGGDPRPVIRTEIDKHAARVSLLMEMGRLSRDDPQCTTDGDFDRELIQLWHDWQPLVRALTNRWPPYELMTADSLSTMVAHLVWCPRPPQISVAQSREIDRRQMEVFRRHFPDGGVGTYMQPFASGETEAYRRYLRQQAFEEDLASVTNKLWREVWPGIGYRRRKSSRLMVKRYVRETPEVDRPQFRRAYTGCGSRIGIRDFCRRWRLNATWAAAIIIESHALHVDTVGDGVYDLSPVHLDVYAPPHPAVLHVTVAGQTVTHGWNGTPSDPRQTIEKECEAAAGRPLNDAERRVIAGQLGPQVARARKELATLPGWGRMRLATWNDEDSATRVLARYLLKPAGGWESVAGAENIDTRAANKAGQRLARSIGLRLPRSRGRYRDWNNTA